MAARTKGQSQFSGLTFWPMPRMVPAPFGGKGPLERTSKEHSPAFLPSLLSPHNRMMPPAAPAAHLSNLMADVACVVRAAPAAGNFEFDDEFLRPASRTSTDAFGHLAPGGRPAARGGRSGG